MKKFIFSLTLLFVGITISAQHIGSEYRLKKVIPVEGRQGIAIDENYYYVSDTKGLYKYDKEGNLLMKNTEPFRDTELHNHFGDIDIFNGEIYTGTERFEYGRGFNIAISIYDAETLQWKRDLPWAPESGQVEVAGVGVDREKNMIWLADWVDSRYIYCYSLETGQYYTKMQCQPTPYWAQGCFIADGKMLITADDGESMYNIPDNIYMIDISAVNYTGLIDGTEVVKETPFSVKLDKDGKPQMRTGKIAGGAQQGRVELFREMNDFRRTGEIEGLSIDPTNDDLVVLNNRGTTIVLGMSQGPIKREGYTKEIRELYVYEKVK